MTTKPKFSIRTLHDTLRERAKSRRAEVDMGRVMVATQAIKEALAGVEGLSPSEASMALSMAATFAIAVNLADDLTGGKVHGAPAPGARSTTLDMLTPCTCGHDYGTHRGRRACGACGCKRFTRKGATS
jgi:hypothetical protein